MSLKNQRFKPFRNQSQNEYIFLRKTLFDFHRFLSLLLATAEAMAMAKRKKAESIDNGDRTTHINWNEDPRQRGDCTE